jgi:hypothetical protein
VDEAAVEGRRERVEDLQRSSRLAVVDLALRVPQTEDMLIKTPEP